MRILTGILTILAYTSGMLFGLGAAGIVIEIATALRDGWSEDGEEPDI